MTSQIFIIGRLLKKVYTLTFKKASQNPNKQCLGNEFKWLITRKNLTALVTVFDLQTFSKYVKAFYMSNMSKHFHNTSVQNCEQMHYYIFLQTVSNKAVSSVL